MTLRVLDHDGDADARLVAILMKKMGLTSLVITPADENAMAHDIEGSCLVLGQCPDRSGAIELKIVADNDLPAADQVIN
jgi:hypothetical protein